MVSLLVVSCEYFVKEKCLYIYINNIVKCMLLCSCPASYFLRAFARESWERDENESFVQQASSEPFPPPGLGRLAVVNVTNYTTFGLCEFGLCEFGLGLLLLFRLVRLNVAQVARGRPRSLWRVLDVMRLPPPPPPKKKASA